MIRPGCWTSPALVSSGSAPLGSVLKFVIMLKSALAFCPFSRTIRRLSHSGADGLVAWLPVYFGLRVTTVDWSMTWSSPVQGGGVMPGANLSPRSTLTSSSRTGRYRQPFPPPGMLPFVSLTFLKPV